MNKYKGLIIAAVIIAIAAGLIVKELIKPETDVCQKCLYPLKDGKHQQIDTCVADIVTEKKDFKVNVFMETSASMDGYVSQPTEFTTVINKFLSCINIAEDSFTYYFICSEINNLSAKNSKLSRKGFLNKLSPDGFRNNTNGGRGNTDMDNILDSVISNTKDDEVSLFISDCILSTSATVQSDARKQLSQRTSDNIKSSIKDKSVSIYKFSSKFSGYFYDDPRYPGQTNYINCNRPFYIWVIGKEKFVSNVTKSIKMQEFRGNQGDTVYSYCFAKPAEKIPYAIDPNVKEGGHKKDRTTVKLANITTGVSILFNPIREQDNAYILMNIEEGYILNPGNYQTSKGIKIDTIIKNTGEYSKAYPYQMTVSIKTKDLKEKREVSISLKYPFEIDSNNKLKFESDKSTGNIKNSSISNNIIINDSKNKPSDTNSVYLRKKNIQKLSQQQKLSDPEGTFGIDILANGVYRAINGEEKPYLFTLKLKLTKK